MHLHWCAFECRWASCSVKSQLAVQLLGPFRPRVSGGGPLRQCWPGLARGLGGNSIGGLFKAFFFEIKNIVPTYLLSFIF